MGIPLDGPTYIFGDNMSVIHNSQRPESVLKKKSIAICYHFTRESVAMGECLTAHICSEDNPADLCTKVMPGGQKRGHLVDMVLHYSTSASNVSSVRKTRMSVKKMLERAKQLIKDQQERNTSSRPGRTG
jgi:hypothetical protein